MFTYDTQYQLVGEDREYASATGLTPPLASDQDGAWDTVADRYVGGKRVEAVDWSFDARGSMKSWTEEEDAPGTAVSQSWGRALGSVIQNGWALNSEACNNRYATATTPPATGDCYLPDALYHANNIADVPTGRGTCTWAEYDAGGRMTRMWKRTGCQTCDYRPGDGDKGAAAATCASRPASGTLGTLGYEPEILTTLTRFEYTWNDLGQLQAASRWENGLQKIVMTYVYDASGNRVIREKSDIPGGLDNIRQDIYLGGYERRQVQFQNDLGQARSINSADGVEFKDVEGTRLVKYASGARMQWKSTGDPITPAVLATTPQIFLTLANHLGSTSAVIDFLTGALVEWKTNYAYGADESGWKNPNPIYDNADEPYGFTGKEEDVEIGLHYFGARYYSSYTARWLGPDPPVVHGGGMSNHFAYGGNSPYIYVDPDGNWVQAVIGAIVGAVVGAVSAAANGGDWKAILIGAAVGAVVGALTGGAGAAASAAAGGGVAGAFAGAAAGAATSAACNMALSAAQGASGKQILITGAISFGSGLVSGAIGAGIGQLGSQAGQAIAGYASSLAVSYGATALSGGLNEDTWDDVLLSSSISYWAGYAGSAVGAEIEGAGGGPIGVNRFFVFGMPVVP